MPNSYCAVFLTRRGTSSDFSVFCYSCTIRFKDSKISVACEAVSMLSKLNRIRKFIEF